MLLGKQITHPGEILQPVSLNKIYQAIKNPDGNVAVLQKRLRAIQMIDESKYRKMKIDLPFLVCGSFSPRIRKKENFVFTDRFILDLDHLSAYNLVLNQLREKINSDPRVELSFSSPGGDGLKIIFALKEKISDTGYYKTFYKSFCIQFGQQYNLEGTIDLKTSDVSRCCFVSYDPEVYFNANPEEVDPSLFTINAEENFELFHSDLEKQEQKIEEERKELGIKTEKEPPLSDDILNQIKEKIGVRVRRPDEKQYIQPQELDKVIPEIIQELAAIDVTMIKIKPIDYGRQLQVGAGKFWAEINIFYGKKGINVVGTTKTGSSRELCNSIVLFLKDHFQNTF